MSEQLKLKIAEAIAACIQTDVKNPKDFDDAAQEVLTIVSKNTMNHTQLDGMFSGFLLPLEDKLTMHKRIASAISTKEDADYHLGASEAIRTVIFEMESFMEQYEEYIKEGR